ncbi:MAG: hypothetical protein L3J39_06085 [Verrucomicrobiales bacterium]|nr:hypothetical protein [Verrucomicrobiales bacterium]
MKKQFGEYQRLAKGIFGCSSLWRGEDHLLYVRGSGFLIPFNEEYLRFRYKDIQSLVIVGTSGQWVSAILYGIGTLLFGLLSYLMLSSREADDVALLVMALVFPVPATMALLLLWVRTLMLGKRCVVEVQTSLKKERLRMLTRLPLARRVLQSVEGLIQASQEDLLEDGVDLSVAERAGGGKKALQGFVLPGSALPTFVLASVMGGLMLLQLHLQGGVSVVMAWATQFMGLVLVPILLFAIAASVRRLTADGIRFSLWALLVSLITAGIGGFVFLINAAMIDPSVTVSPVVYIGAFSGVNRVDQLGFYLFFLVVALSFFIFGALGSWLALSHKGGGKA